MVDLFIELNSPNGVYFPGMVVSGHVFMRLKEQTKARCVLVSILGKARTQWTVWEKRSHNRSSTTESVPYWSEMIYIKQEMCVWTDSTSETKKLPAGESRFPFSFVLPINLPPTFEGTIGFIRYHIKAKIDRPFRFDNVLQRAFTVTPHFDLNSINYAGLPSVKQTSKNFGILLFKHGCASVKVMLAKTGYVSGESIALSMEVSNMSKKDIQRVEVSLVQTALCTAQRQGHHHHFNTGVHFRHKDVETKEEIRTVVQYCENFHVNKHSTSNYQRLLAIPPVKVIAKGINNSITSELPLLIGTIPIRPATTAQSIEFPSLILPPTPSAPPPDYETSQLTYGSCLFGKGTMADDQDKAPDFTPNYIVYNNLP